MSDLQLIITGLLLIVSGAWLFIESFKNLKKACKKIKGKDSK